MAKLTKEEMAVLNSLIYLETNVWNESGGTDKEQPKKLGDIVSELERNHDLWQCGGGMDEETFKNLFKIAREDPSLRELELFQVRESDYEKYHTSKSDAPILAFKNGDNPVVVFRGTESGTEEENDNFRGINETDTEAQKRALGYITILHDEYGFDNISVSGHSKGGNKAMYVTLLSDYVSDCTAFDSQGFSLAFREKYRGQIAGKKDKITMIASNQAVVGSLLSPIAGQIIYTSTEGLAYEECKLGMLPYHKMNTFYTINDGNIQLREEAECSVISGVINRVSRFVSAAAVGYNMDAAFFPEIADVILQDFMENAGGTMDNWLKGVKADGSPALSTQIMSFLEDLFPGLDGGMSEGLTSLAISSESGLDILTVMQYFGERIPILAAKMAEGTVTVGGMEMAVGSGTVFAVVAAVTVVWAFVKTLELVIPLLLNAGIAASEVCGFALGLAASWIMDCLSGIGQAVKDGFGLAVDGFVRLGNLTVEAARTAGNAVASAVESFMDGIAGFFGKMAEGTAAWIQGVFGSADAAIAYAQDIDVTMSRIEEMRVCLENLRQCYMNAGNATVGARQMTDRVYSYYHESYVRSCCRDIQYHLKSAGSGINSAERALDRKRRVLAAAAEAYRRNDREAAETIRRYAHG